MLVTQSALSIPFEAIARAVSEHAAELVAIRRDLHAHPELARGEVRTTSVVAERLERAGIGVRHLRGTGLVADLGAAQPTRRIALRADIDALPIREQTGLDFASRTDGVSHACGHDVHTTALLGAALALRSVEDRLWPRASARASSSSRPRRSCPAEPRTSSARAVSSASTASSRCTATRRSTPGRSACASARSPAAADQVEVTLSGRGGHTSRPHLTQDLTYALAKVVTDVPGVLSRRLDPRAGAALVWGSVHSGGAYNVIPAIGKVGGTLRMLDASVWEGVERLLEEVVHAVVAPYAVQAEVLITKGVPPVVNDAVVHRRRSPRRSPERAPTSRRRRSPWAARTSRGTSPTCPARWRGSAPGRPVVRPTTCTAATSSSTRPRSLSAPAPWRAPSSPLRPPQPARRGSAALLLSLRSRIGNTSR